MVYDGVCRLSEKIETFDLPNLLSVPNAFRFNIFKHKFSYFNLHSKVLIVFVSCNGLNFTFFFCRMESTSTENEYCVKSNCRSGLS